jgi:hypothetical protein
MEFYEFNPALQDPQILQDIIIGRDEIVNDIKRILKSASSGGSFSHPIFIGAKGIGKTHLLQLVFHGINGVIDAKGIREYKDSFTAVCFSEEEYLSGILDFVMLILKHLSNLGFDDAKKLRERLKDKNIKAQDKRELAISYLEEFKVKTGKVLLLLIDNLNDILSCFSEEDQSVLRVILMKSNSVLLIGSAPTFFDSIIDYDQPLYNFFEVIWLKDITFDQTEILLKKFAELDKNTDVIEKIKDSRGRVRSIFELAGGTPRLILTLYRIIAEDDTVKAETTMLKILDSMTGYFNLRMKDLPPQQRKIMDIIAVADRLLTQTEIAEECQLPVNTVNSQIKRLEDSGYLKKVSKGKKKRVYYDISERLFSLWRRMRVEGGKERLTFIVRFFEIWFTRVELKKHLEHTFSEISKQAKSGNCEIDRYVNKLWYIKEAIGEYKGQDLDEIAYENNPDATLAIIENDLKADPNNVKKLIKIGYLYCKQDRNEDANEIYKKSIGLEPDNYKAWLGLGITCDTINLTEEAIEAIKKSIELKSDEYITWYYLSIFLFKIQKLDESLHAIEKAFYLNPESEEIQKTLTINHIVFFLFEGVKDNQGNAIEHLRRSIKFLKKLKEKEPLFDLYAKSLKDLLAHKKTDMIKSALSEIESSELGELYELLTPFVTFIKYLETKDEDIIDRRRREDRIIMDAMLELYQNGAETENN